MGHYVHHYVCVCVCVGAGRVGDTEADKRLARQTDRQTDGPSCRTLQQDNELSGQSVSTSCWLEPQGSCSCVHLFTSLSLSISLSLSR